MRCLRWCLGFIVATGMTVGQAAEDKPDEAAVQRARDTAQMLDDMYKTAVVLITETYVNDEGDVAAATAAKALFKAVEAKGYHQARIIDATGNPYDVSNVAAKGFETRALKKIKAGEAKVEELESGDDGQSYLRVMTAVPVVMAKCTMCHPHYKDVPAGQAIGALSYRIPVK